jgi:hypothetical protein
MNDSDDFARMNDSELLGWRAQTRAELEQLAPGSPGHAALTARYDVSTAEVNDRARRAWSRAD